jgi:hypothetical protein
MTGTGSKSGTRVIGQEAEVTETPWDIQMNSVSTHG